MKNIFRLKPFVLALIGASPLAHAAVSLSNIQLVNAETGAVISTLADKATIDLSKLPTRKLSILATSSPTKVGSVRFGLDAQSNLHTETYAPYYLMGDQGAGKALRPIAWTPAAGAHTLVVTPYTKANASGAGTARTIHFTVVDGDTSAPTVSLVPPATQSSAVNSAQTLKFIATAKDNVGVTEVRFYDNDVLKHSEQAAPYEYDWAVTEADEGVHQISARAVDKAGNVGSSSPFAVTVAMADTVAPTVPAKAAAQSTCDKITLTWGASTDAGSGVAGYRVYRDGAQIYQGVALNYSESDVHPFDRRSYTVTAFDAKGNESAPTALVKARVPSCPMASNAVVITPAQNIADVAAKAAEGTSFLIKAGTYRMQKIVPKRGQKFWGEKDTILSGAALLTSFTREGDYYVASNQTQAGQVVGGIHPEDFSIDDVRYDHAATKAEVVKGKSFFFDYDNDKIYFLDDPTGKRVEIATTTYAFTQVNGKEVADVEIHNLTIEKYATPAQQGTIKGDRTQNWIVEGNTLRWNHGTAVRTGNAMKIVGNRILYSGQMNIGGSAITDALVERNEIAYGNTAGYNWGWEAGGTKWTRSHNLIVRCNYSHDNKGPGLWTDIGNHDSLYERNVVVHNEQSGIMHEISYDVEIRDNVLIGNGYVFDTWLWGAQILISTSNHAKVHDNVLEVGANGGNGIAVLQQNRSIDGLKIYATDNTVYDNDVTYLGSRGATGLVVDYLGDAFWAGRNTYNTNTYHLTSATRKAFSHLHNYDFKGFQSFGEELGGHMDTTVVANKTPHAVPECD